MESEKISSIREDYKKGELLEEHLEDNPFAQFSLWFKDAVQQQVFEVNAMALSTVSAEGTPSSRIVLLKDFDDNGFVFYTNYESRKARELIEKDRAALLFFWPQLQRQVRIEGSIIQVDAEQSDEYFHSRPRGSQLGAWASPQSQVIPDRAFLDNRLAEINAKFSTQKELDRPPHWGGFVLNPVRVEFWQGRSNRLHDRLVYERLSNAERWIISRLAP